MPSKNRKAICRRYYLRNEIDIRDYRHLMRLAFPEKYKNNPVIHRCSSEKYRKANLEKCRAAIRRHYDKHVRGNPHKIAEHNHKRRDKISKIKIDCSEKIKQLQLKRFCRWCCNRLEII